MTTLGLEGNGMNRPTSTNANPQKMTQSQPDQNCARTSLFALLSCGGFRPSGDSALRSLMRSVWNKTAEAVPRVLGRGPTSLKRGVNEKPYRPRLVNRKSQIVNPKSPHTVLRW